MRKQSANNQKHVQLISLYNARAIIIMYTVFTRLYIPIILYTVQRKSMEPTTTKR